LFAEQAAKTPLAVALVFGAEQLTYGELNERANQVAHHLRTLGVKPESLVGLYVERSVAMVIAMLGVLKAGGAYVPLDPDYPVARLQFMLADTAAKVVISDRPLPGDLALPGITVVNLAADQAQVQKCARTNPDQAGRAGQLAYVIYTSGSSGQPKGVQVEHRGVVNLCAWHQRFYQVTAADRATQVASPSFDASVWELWPYLTAGASVQIAAKATLLSPASLLAWLAAQRITLCFLPTPLAEAVLQESLPPNLVLRTLLTGGDRLRHAPPVGTPFQVVNNYGPTENTVVSTSGVVTNGRSGLPTIGRPIGNTEAYILDGELALVPVGVVGELYLGGAGLARGYLNRAELTREKFIPHPFKPEARLYKTGDLARWLPDGELEYVGRADQQVKVRGFRIELGEIEAVLGLHPDVATAVVAADGQQLVAYVVVRAGTAPTVAELREFLLQQLPEHMVPGVYVTLAALPLTPNGKVDRRALPGLAAANAGRLGPGVAYAAPQTAVEQALAEIWGELLGVARVGVQDNFFALGGHSLLAVRLVNQVKARLHLDLPMRTLFQHPTIQEIAQVLSVPKNVGRKPELIQLQAGNQAGPELFFLIDEGSLGLFKLAHFMGAGRSLFASVVPLPEAALKASAKRRLAALPKMEDLAAEHVALIKSRPTKAPVLLAGHCFGGMLALEVARQLAAAGIPVAGVLLLDTWFARPTFWWQKKTWLSEHLGKLRQQGPRYLWRKSRRRIGLEKEALASRMELSRSGDFSAQVPWAIIARIYRRAMAGYQPKPWPGRGLLLVSQDDWESNAYRQHDDTLGARHIFQGGVTVVNVPGDHVSVLEEPNLPELAARLNVGLEKFLVKNPSHQTSAKLETLADLNYGKQSPRQLSNQQSSFSCS
jgi:amino acid adenylation domain-containing protein